MFDGGQLCGRPTGYREGCRGLPCREWKKAGNARDRTPPESRQPIARNTITPAASSPPAAPREPIRATTPTTRPAPPRPSQRLGLGSTPASIMAQQQRAQTGVIWERGASPYRRPATSAPTAAPAQAAPPPPETPVRSPWAKLKPGRLRDTLEAATGPL